MPEIHTTPSVVVRILLWLLLLVGGTAFSVATDRHDPLFHSVSFHAVSFCIGTFLVFMAFRAAANGGRELKKGRTGDTPRLETNRIVTTGIYACMRHPMLFGLALLPPGLAFLVGSPTFIAVVAPAEMFFIAVMVLVFEEMEVRRKFGAAYEAYREKVPAVSFRYDCLKRLFGRVPPS